MISRQVSDRADELRAAFVSAAPFRHLCIDDFFEPAKAEALLRDFPRFDKELARNEFGKYGRKAVQPKLADISPLYAEVYAYLSSRAFLDLMERITGIAGLIADPGMFGGGTHENLDGQALDPHIDFNCLESGEHRRINLLLYLNKGWDPDWGGQLELHTNPREPDRNVISAFNVPFNRCVLFETNEISWHGFDRIRLPTDAAGNSRKSLSVYLYTKSRPDAAGRHGTFYVQRPLDPTLVAGRTLDEADLQEIQGAVRNRDRWIEAYQKKEEAQGSKYQDLLDYCLSLQTQLTDARAKSGLPLVGYASFRQLSEGIHYPDKWATRTLSIELEALRPLTRAEVTVAITEQMPSLRRRLAIGVAGEPRSERDLDGHGAHALSLPVTIPAGTVFALTIECSEDFVPRELGLGNDDRALAYLLQRIAID